MATLTELGGKVPPQNLEAERAVLGAILLEPGLLPRAIEALTPDEFYKDGHRKIYGAMLRLFERSEPADQVTVTEELRREGAFDDVGGHAALATLMEEATVATQFAAYAAIVREKALLRELIRVAREIVEEGYAEADDVQALLDRSEQMLFRISQRRFQRSVFPVREILTKAIQHIETLYHRKEDITGLATGFNELDKRTAGLQRADFVIIAGRPSTGKCLAFDSEILLEDGSLSTIEAVYRRRQARLLTLTSRWTFEVTEPGLFVDDGQKPVFRVTTRLGRQAETTLTHPFRTIEGWRPLSELKAGAHVAVPRVLDVFGTDVMRDCEVTLLGYLIGDGGLTGTTPRFTNGDPRLRADFAQAVAEFGGLDVSREDSGGTRTPYLSVHRDWAATRQARDTFAAALRRHVAGRGARRRLAMAVGVSPASVTHWTSGRTVPDRERLAAVARALAIESSALAPRGHEWIAKNDGNALRHWLAECGLWGSRAADKVVPPRIFRLPRRQVALFLNRLFATDGWASVSARGQAQIGYATTSERLARQVQHLLLRFGVIASLRRRLVRYREERRPAWQLEVTDGRSITTLAREIGIFGKEDAAERVCAAVAGRRAQTNRDLVPCGVWARIAEAKGQESWGSLARRAGARGWTNLHAGRRALSRPRLRALATALDSRELLELANSEVYWDAIVSIEPAGTKQVYDLTIPETHNFVANDVCVHNTAFALNIAEHVAVDLRQPALFFSLEMSKEQLVQRLICAEARVDSQKVRSGYLQPPEWRRIIDAAGRLSEAPLFVDDTANLSVLEARAKARRVQAEYGLELVVIDYLQLMQGRWRSENRQQEISEISRSLKALSKELNVPVVALSQLSRAVEARGDALPRLSDLRESGALEQDADLIMFLARKDTGPESEPGTIDLVIGKHRNGPTGKLELVFNAQYTRFDDLSSRRDRL